MTRRTAIQYLAAVFAVMKGEQIMTDQNKAVAQNVLNLSDFKPTAFRLHLDPGIRLEVVINGEVVEIPQDELRAALTGDR